MVQGYLKWISSMIVQLFQLECIQWELQSKFLLIFINLWISKIHSHLWIFILSKMGLSFYRAIHKPQLIWIWFQELFQGMWWQFKFLRVEELPSLPLFRIRYQTYFLYAVHFQYSRGFPQLKLQSSLKGPLLLP